MSSRSFRRCGRGGVRGFYDADEQIELWGRKYLAEELPAIYGEQVVVVFVSAEYAARDWTRHERQAALGPGGAGTAGVRAAGPFRSRSRVTPAGRSWSSTVIL